MNRAIQAFTRVLDLLRRTPYMRSPVPAFPHPCLSSLCADLPLVSMMTPSETFLCQPCSHLAPFSSYSCTKAITFESCLVNRNTTGLSNTRDLHTRQSPKHVLLSVSAFRFLIIADALSQVITLSYKHSLPSSCLPLQCKIHVSLLFR